MTKPEPLFAPDAPAISDDHQLATGNPLFVSPIDAITAPADGLDHADVMTRTSAEVLQARGEAPFPPGKR